MEYMDMIMELAAAGRTPLPWYLLAVNVLTFVMFGVDKRRAILDQWRISEKTLLFLTAAGGSVGALLGMRIFHHKTRKSRFRILVPAFLALHAALFLKGSAG